MDGGAKDSGYAARIAAAFRELEETNTHARSDLQDPEILNLDGALPDDDGPHRPEEGGASSDTNAETQIQPRRRFRLPNMSFGISNASAVPSTLDAGDDDYLSDTDRYSASDAAYDFDEEIDDVIETSDGESNLEFHAERDQLVWLLLKNTLLTIATLGIYRFWAQRELRRYLWSTISFQEGQPEYQGRAIDSILAFGAVALFTLFLAGVLIVLPQLFVPMRPVTAAMELFFVAGLFLTYQVWCQWRRRYNLDHTAFHGIRFERAPQSLRRLLPFVGIWSLVLLTAGLAYPLARVITARDLFKDVRFGPASVVIDANAQPLLLPWAIVYGTFLFTFIVVGTDLVFQYPSASGAGILLYWLGSATLIIACFGALVWYRCGEFDYCVSGIYVGQSRAYTDLPPWRILMKASLPVFGFLIFSLSLFLFAFFSFGAFFQLTAEKSPAEIDINYLLIALGFAATLIGGFIYQVVLNLFRLDVLSAVAERGSIE